MKLACIIHSLNGGGAERVLAGLSSRLSQRGHDVTLITLDDGTQDKHSVDASVHRVHLDVMRESHSILSRLKNSRIRLRGIRETVADLAPDVVLSFCDRTNITVLTALKNSATPVVISERSDPAEQHLGWLWEMFRRRAYRDAWVIALTDTSARHLQAMTTHPVTVIPSAVDVPPVISDRTDAMKNRRVIAIGRLEHEKGFDRLVNAFATIRSEHPNWTLRILGEGSCRESLIAQAETLGIAQQFELPGWTRPIWGELADATIFVLPSRYEGFPSALMEAMASGVPSIAVDCESGPRAVVQHSIDGLLIENNESAIADALREMISDESKRERLGTAARAVVDRLGWDAMVDAYENVLTERLKVQPAKH